MATEIDIDFTYEAREQFIPYHERKERWACIVAHRRAGKTVACINDLVDACIRCGSHNPRMAYITPLYAQAKDVAWVYLKEAIAPLIPYGATINEAELRVDLPNGGRVRLYGSDNYDRMRGIYLDGVVLDEYGDMDPRAWAEVIRPALSDRKGFCTFIGTPKGENAFFDTWLAAQDDPEWFTLMLKASETGIVDAEELIAAKKQMTDDQYRQEYECSFSASVIGSFYGSMIEQADDQGRICSVPHDAGLLVNTAFDLGVSDSTSIWAYQTVGKEIRIINHYEASGHGLEHYAKKLFEWRDQLGYSYDRHWFPHDVEVRELGTGKTRVETLAELGIKASVAPKLSVDDGINAVRCILSRCWFDKEKCAAGVKALRQYRVEYDDKRKTFRKTPLHDWSSHSADAFRYLAVSLKENKMHRPLVYNNAGIV